MWNWYWLSDGLELEKVCQVSYATTLKVRPRLQQALESHSQRDQSYHVEFPTLASSGLLARHLNAS